MLIFAENRKARFEYKIEKEFECGIELFGFEVKSIRANRINISDSYVLIENAEIFLINTHIAKYKMAFKDSDKNYNEKRKRKLLLNKNEINKLMGLTQKKGYTIVPLKVFQKNNFIKVQVALCQGKTDYDKRESIKNRDLEREARIFKNDN